MAIVDIKHTQTIEEMLRDGGAQTIKVIPYVTQWNGGNGGFVKDMNPIAPTFYTYEEIQQIFRENPGSLYAVDASLFGSRGLGMFERKGATRFIVSGAVFESPEPGETTMYVTTYKVSIDSSNEFTVDEHVWYFSITNDD